MKTILNFAIISLMLLVLVGCENYTTPSGPAMSIFAGVPKDKVVVAGEPDVNEPNEVAGVAFEQREPMAKFPANIVYVRTQEQGYKSQTAKGEGWGAFSVVYTRDIEKDSDWEQLGQMVNVAQIGPLSKLLVPAYLQSEKDLRQAAARLNSDMLLIYTLDTNFMDRDTSAGLTVITLGLGATINVRVTSTVSALLLDTRSGYVYGVVEETAMQEKNTAALTSKNAMDNMRLAVERQAFEQFINEFELLWKNVSEEYAD
ncbi:MAG: hypothetical protein WC962_02385 [Phycisphaerae bacterium]|jgi:hypothetical protein